MKQNILLITLFALAANIMLAPVSRSQWLTHTPDNSQPAGYATNAIFNGVTSGNYFGPVTVQVTNDSSGTVPGIVGISPDPFSNVTSTFLNHFPLDPGTPGTFDFLNVQYNDNLDKYTVTFNFAALPHGLPSGTLIAFLDVDILENVKALSATDTNNNPITGAWLGLPNTGLPVFDYDNALGNSILPQFAAIEGYNNGVYAFIGDSQNQTATFQGFQTQQNINSLSFEFDDSQGSPVGTGGYGIAILAPVPEPSVPVLAAVGGFVAFILVRRRGRARDMSMKSTTRGALVAVSVSLGMSLSTYAATYQIDDGTAEFDWGNQDPPGGDLIALNKFAITGGNNLITSIEIAWGNPNNIDPTLNGLQYTAVLWKDGSGVGNPSGAVVLMTIPNQIISGAGTNTFVTSTFSSPVLVPTSNFFVGFLITNAPGQRPAAVDFSLFNSGQSFMATAPPGQGDIFNLNANPNGVEAFDPIWLIRANAIPEPSTYALIGVGLVLGIHRFVCRRSA